jgi:hypothetical protein
MDLDNNSARGAHQILTPTHTNTRLAEQICPSAACDHQPPASSDQTGRRAVHQAIQRHINTDVNCTIRPIKPLSADAAVPDLQSGYRQCRNAITASCPTKTVDRRDEEWSELQTFRNAYSGYWQQLGQQERSIGFLLYKTMSSLLSVGRRTVAC